jgi:folate-dependent phosphoribosylglycinamide formyltransferase PurN
MKILYLSTLTVHHLFVKEKLEDEGCEVSLITEQPVDFATLNVFFKQINSFVKRPSVKGFIKKFPFIRIGLFDKLRSKSEENMLPLKRVHKVALHLKNINYIASESIVENDWSLVIVFGTRKISSQIINIFKDRNIPMINIHCAVLPYIKGLDSDYWSLYRRKWKEIGVTVHFVDEELDTGQIVGTSFTDFKKLSFPWQIRGVSTMAAIEIIKSNLRKIENYHRNEFIENRIEESEYFSFFGILVQIIAIVNFYFKKLLL